MCIQVLIVFLLFTVICRNHSFELAVCDRPGIIQKGYQLPVSAALAGSKTDSRSLIECLIKCYDSGSSCQSSFYSDEGSCYHLNEKQPLQESPAFQGSLIVNNNLYNSLHYVDRDSQGLCNNGTCPEDHFCIDGCNDETFGHPVCLAPEEKGCSVIDEYSNIRNYVGTKSDNLDSGELMVLSYEKKSDSTGIRLIFNFEARAKGVGEDPHCAQWYFTFDGAKCSYAANLHHTDFSVSEISYSRTAHIDGVCWGIAAKTVSIKLLVGACSGHSSGSVRTSDKLKGRNLIVMEVKDAETSWEGKVPCSSLSTFNLKTEVWSEDNDVTFDTSTGSQLVKEVDYVKIESDSLLRIKYSAVLGINAPTNDARCGQWVIKVNGEECGPYNAGGEIAVQQPSPQDYWSQSASSRTIEAICDNQYNAGSHKVQIYMSQCRMSYTQPTNFVVGGIPNAPSSLMIEEVRLNQTSDVVLGAKGVLHRVYTGIRLHTPFSKLNVDTSENEFVVYSYQHHKKYADTGLKLTAFGSYGVYKNETGNSETCGRWYFQIDGEACANPGTIGGIITVNRESDYWSPLYVDGVCYDLSAGTHTIEYHTKKCRSNIPLGTVRVGYESPFFFSAEEIRIDELKKCDSSGTPLDCTQ